MIDEKDPAQESAKADSADDELIIDLTDEVIVKTEDDDGKLKSADDTQQAMEDDEASEVEEDEEILVLDETDHSDLQEDEAAAEQDGQDAEDQNEFPEDRHAASAIGAFPDTDEADPGEVTEEFDLNAFDEDDTVIVDNSRDEVDENYSAMAGNENAAAQRDEDIFDLEKDIELDYALDDDEDEFIELKDEHIDDDQDFVDLMLSGSNEADQDDEYDAPTEYIEFKTDEQGDVIVLDADRNQDPETMAPAEEEAPDFEDSDDLPDLEAIGQFDFENEEDDLALDEPEADSTKDLSAAEATTEFDDSDELPDLEALGGLDFESEEDEESGLALDEPEADGSDDIIARSVKPSLGQNDDREPVEPAAETELSLDDDDAIMDLDDTSAEEEIILTLADEEPLSPEADDDLLDLNGTADLGANEEIIALDGLDDLEAEDEEEIIEITEFDQHFPADSEALLRQSGILDASGADEDDFLELIDVEEDSLSDDQALAEFNDLTQKSEVADNAKINQFFSDDLEENQPQTSTPESIYGDELENLLLKDEAAESIFGDTEAMKLKLDDEVPAAAEKASDLDFESTTDAEIPVAESEKFDFDFDHRAIARQVDRLDTFLSGDAAEASETTSLPIDQDAEPAASELGSTQIGQGLDGLPAMPADQINAAIERVISEKFSSKIEGIIYEVIEKAVAKEIDRLKRSLIGTSAFDDYED